MDDATDRAHRSSVWILSRFCLQGDLTSTDLRQMLGLDAGYMSRLISGFDKKGLIQKVPSTTDARAIQLHITDFGREVLAPLEQASRQEVITLLERLSEPQQLQLIASMKQNQTLLEGGQSTTYLRGRLRCEVYAQSL